MKPFLFLCGLLLIWSCTPKQPEIHEWRGKDRSGIYDEHNLLQQWPEEGPREIWYLEGIGSGFGSPVPAGERLYITGALDSTAWLHCIGLDGKILWQRPFGKEWMATFPGSRSAPTIVGGLIYVGSGMGSLYCMEKDSGNVVWSRDFPEAPEGAAPLFGHAEAAVVDGDRVFWTPGAEEMNVVALDRHSGELLWSNPGFGERSAYHPPAVIARGGRKILVTFSAYHLMGFDTENGEMLWSHEQDNLPPEQRKPGYGDVHANSILYEGGYLYYATGDGNCAVKLALSEDGSSITEVWRNQGLDTFMGGIVKAGNSIYGCGIEKPGLKALDAATGELTDSLKIGQGAVIGADGMLYYYNWKGEMKLVRYEKGKLEEVSSFRIMRGTKEHFSHPVIYRGVLYQRHGDVLMAFNISFT
jgi:outer membrane protein assembly factor BamB